MTVKIQDILQVTSKVILWMTVLYSTAEVN